MTLGCGKKRAVSWLVTSAISALCSIDLRDFIVRTIAASICGLRSSSTFARVSSFSMSVSFAAVTVPTLNRRCLAENSALYLSKARARAGGGGGGAHTEAARQDFK